jgi:hypothetical protein
MSDLPAKNSQKSVPFVLSEAYVKARWHVVAATFSAPVKYTAARISLAARKGTRKGFEFRVPLWFLECATGLSGGLLRHLAEILNLMVVIKLGYGANIPAHQIHVWLGKRSHIFR